MELKPRVLIVDDEIGVRQSLEVILEDDYHVLSAVNGQEALIAVERGFAENDPYNLICLDIMMPVMDGQQTLQEIRKMEERYGIGGVHATKVIMVTAADDSKNILKAFRQGQCEAYLTKPLDREKLITHIRDLDLID